MSRITWDKTGERTYETGVSNGVLYIPDATGAYVNGYGWNGLTAVTESPSGAESNPQYADNIKYLNLKSAEEFGATVEAFTYPKEFGQCDGSAIVNGVELGQQNRRSFGLSYQTLIGNDVENNDYGRKIHLIYGADAAPSERAYATVNESPEAITFSWELTTTPVAVGEIAGKMYKPTASLTISSTNVPAATFAALEDILYGTAGTDPRLPSPTEVITMFAGAVVEVTPTKPTNVGNAVTIPSVTGVTYKIAGEAVTGVVTITKNTIVKAQANSGYKFPPDTDDDWLFTFS